MSGVVGDDILQDRDPLVTGGSRGIGRNISLAVAGAV